MTLICFVYYCIANTAPSEAMTENDAKLLDIKHLRKEILDSINKLSMQKFFETELAKLKSFFLTDRKFFVTFEHLNDDVPTVMEAAQNVMKDLKSRRSLSRIKELTTELDVLIETLMPVLEVDFDAITLFHEVVKFKLTNSYFLLEIYALYDECSIKMEKIENDTNVHDKISDIQKALETCCDNLSSLFDEWEKTMKSIIKLLATKSKDYCSVLRTENTGPEYHRTPQQLYWDLKDHIVSLKCSQRCIDRFFSSFRVYSVNAFALTFLDELTTFMQNMLIYAKLDAQIFTKRVERYVTTCKNEKSIPYLKTPLRNSYEKLHSSVLLYQLTFKISLSCYTRIFNNNIERSRDNETQKTDFDQEMKVVMYEYLKVFEMISEIAWCRIPRFYKKGFKFN